MTQVEKQKVIEESKSSGNKCQTEWHYPKTKREAIDLMDLGARISLSENLAGNIIHFLQNVGADNELPSDHKNRVAWLNHFHKQLAVNNPLWPEEIPFGFVYGSFVNAIMYDRVELKGHNVHAFISAFKRWITQSGIEDRLYRSYYDAHPDKKPKALSDKITETEEDKQIRAKGFVNEPPETVKRLVGIYEKLHGAFEDALASVEGERSYRRRLFNTMKKYKDEGNWPE